MRLCKNKNTGKHFIVIENTGISDLSLITPNLSIKNGLDMNLFDDDFEVDENFALSQGYISNEQLSKYNEFIGNRADEAMEKIMRLPPSHRENIFKKLKKRFE